MGGVQLQGNEMERIGNCFNAGMVQLVVGGERRFNILQITCVGWLCF